MPYTLQKNRSRLDKYIDPILLTFNKSPTDNSAVFELVLSYEHCNHLFGKLGHQIKNTGDLNYTISRILWSLLYRTRRYYNAEDMIGVVLAVQHRLRYEQYEHSYLCDILYYIIKCSMIGVMNKAEQTLECVKLEMYRRHISVYEDEKINTSENGDVNYEWPKRSTRNKKPKRDNKRKVTARRKRLG